MIGTPLKSGVERTEDDVSLFLLNEFVVQAQASEAGETVVEDIETRAEEVEEQLVEFEEQAAAPRRARSTRRRSSLATSDLGWPHRSPAVWTFPQGQIVATLAPVSRDRGGTT
jgi:hypothetical protein